MAASEAEVRSSDWLQKRLRVEVQDQLAKLFTQFRDDLGVALSELDQRILPAVNRTIGRIEGIQRDFDYAPLVAGAGVATAGYAIVATVLPWVAGAAGVAAVTAGLASFIPGVGVAIGALLGSGLKASVTGAISIFSSTAVTAQDSYVWLRNSIRQFQQKGDKEQRLDQLTSVIDKMKQDAIDRLESSIDPVQITTGIMVARFPQQQALEDRRVLATKLDRTRLRETLHDLKDLRNRLIHISNGPE